MIIEMGLRAEAMPMNWRSAEIILVYNEDETYPVGKDKYNIFPRTSYVLHIGEIAKILLARVE